MLIDRTYKEGIDKQIAKLQSWMHKKLLTTWTLDNTTALLYKCYPRCYRNQTETGYIPEVKLADDATRYQEVLWDNKLYALSFFGMGQRLDFDVSGTQDVHIIFFTNLNSLKPGNERRDEEIRLDVMQHLDKNMYGFNLKRVITGVKDVLREYDGSRVLNKDFEYKVDMHPNHCFRFDLELVYNPTQCY